MIKKFALWLSILVGAVAIGQIPISNLPPATTPLSGNEIIPGTQNGQTKAIKVSQIVATSAPSTNPFILQSAGTLVPNARILTGTGNQINLIDGGPGGNLTLSLAGGAFTGFSNPSANVGLTVVNGVATTAMRSDAAPALNVGISPTWTGSHIFSIGGQTLTLRDPLNSGNAAITYMAFQDSATTRYGYVGKAVSNADFYLVASLGGLHLQSNNTDRVTIATAGNVTIAAPTSAPHLTLADGGGIINTLVLGGSTGNGTAIKLLGSSVGQGKNWLIGNQNNASDTLEFTPSTANGGATFTTPSLKITGAGNVTINAPSAGTALTINGFAGQVPLAVTADNTGNWSATFTSTSATESRAAIAFVNNRTTSETWAIGQNADGGTDKSFTIRDVTRNAVPFNITNTGNVTIAAPSSGDTLRANAATNSWAGTFIGNSTVGSSYGVNISAGTNNSDFALRVTNQSAAITLARILGDGSGLFGYNGTTNTITASAAGNVNIAAPSSGIAFSASGASGQFVSRLTANSGVGASYGLDILAGTNNVDQALRVLSQDTTKQFFTIFGDGHGTLGPSATLGLSWDTGGVTTITGVGAYLFLNSSTATNAPLLRLSRGGTEKARFGVEGTAGGTVSGSAVDDIFISAFAAGNIIFSNAPAIKATGPVAAALVDMTPDTSTFTGTLTGCTTSPTTTVTWSRIGKLVMLELGVLTATSNTTAMTVTGMPAAIRPASSQGVSIASTQMENNGVVDGVNYDVRIDATGVINFGRSGNLNGWTAANVKGIVGSITISYMLN